MCGWVKNKILKMHDYYLQKNEVRPLLRAHFTLFFLATAELCIKLKKCIDKSQCTEKCIASVLSRQTENLIYNSSVYIKKAYAFLPKIKMYTYCQNIKFSVWQLLV